ncbi:MAG TPA: diphthine--ammonia ligase [Thermoplasmata archaeon]|nr:diphthine--ammonia ligase [Thermoplasmata archaeon]
MNLTALVSGGKDSIFAAHLAEIQGWTVDELVTVKPSDPESMMFHTPNLHLVELQAAAWGKKFRAVDAPGSGEVADSRAVESALTSGSDWVSAGAIASSYQWARLHRAAFRTGRRVFAPLWGKSAGNVVREEIASGLDIRLVHLSAEPLGADLAGARLDAARLADLERRSAERRPIHLAGEGGEFETLVVDAPFFRQRIDLVRTEVVSSGAATTFVVKEARLVPKGS